MYTFISLLRYIRDKIRRLRPVQPLFNYASVIFFGIHACMYVRVIRMPDQLPDDGGDDVRYIVQCFM